ncbi:FtsX-like permease family protein [Candidatus Schneideria nysicola]|uniref:FtsX-like permease family protein n=1 Tax=Candidatus Schneideria nysicola TaxID=1081631 RepID=UPI001CAA4B5C|nr:FtsX-like permease family protein [Candidatus Schneideria nysicola]UAJ65681.1 FtsX-like permease family protein [Candidatus Schneideria nysicola]
MFYISLRYVQSYSNRFYLFIKCFSISGIAIGVMVLTIVISVMNGLENEFKIHNMRFIPHIVITTKKGWLNTQEISISSLIGCKNILYITPFITGDVLLQNQKNITNGTLVGINTSDPEPISNYLINACIKQLVSGEYKVFLGSELANRLDLKKGDKVKLITSIKQYTPIGSIFLQKIFTVAGIYYTNTEVDSYQLLLHINDAAALMHYPNGCVTGWRLWLKNPINPRYFFSIPPNLICKDFRTNKLMLIQAIQMEKKIIMIIIFFIILIAIFNIIIILIMFIIDKKNEIAILKAQGLKNKSIMMIFIIYGIIISIIGIILGLIFGIFLLKNIEILLVLMKLIGIVSKTTNIIIPVSINISQIIFLIMIIISLTFIIGIYPSWYATTIKPSKCLR